MSLLGVDIGTTGVKAVAFTPEGEILADAYREYPTIQLKPGWLEVDAEIMFERICDVLQAVGEATSDDPPKAMAMSAMGESFVPVSEDGEFLDNTLLSADTRALEQAERLEDTLGAQKIFQITGMPAHPSFSLGKMMWLKENKPDIHEETYKYLLWPDVVMMKLGLQPRLDHSLAGRTMAFDIRERDWSPTMLQTAGIPREKLPEPIASGSVVGELGPTAAEMSGLPEGCLVVAGGHDQPMNALGAGVINEGQAVDGMGTVECITTAFDEPVVDESLRKNNYCCYPHVYGDMYCTIAFNYTSGELLRWYRDNLAEPEQAQAAERGIDVYEVILSDLPEDPTRILVVPYLTGSATPHMDPLASGVIVGLNLGTDRKTLVKALVEGTCYELNLNIQFLAEGGVNIDRLRATGGGSKSPVWLQIKADVTGREVVTLNVRESGCLAAGMLSGTAVGEYESIERAVDLLVREKDRYNPDPQVHEEYAEVYASYRDLWPTVSDIAHSLRKD